MFQLVVFQQVFRNNGILVLLDHIVINDTRSVSEILFERLMVTSSLSQLVFWCHDNRCGIDDQES